jgi:TonB family protein
MLRIVLMVLGLHLMVIGLLLFKIDCHHAEPPKVLTPIALHSVTVTSLPEVPFKPAKVAPKPASPTKVPPKPAVSPVVTLPSKLSHHPTPKIAPPPSSTSKTLPHPATEHAKQKAHQLLNTLAHETPVSVDEITTQTASPALDTSLSHDAEARITALFIDKINSIWQLDNSIDHLEDKQCVLALSLNNEGYVVQVTIETSSGSEPFDSSAVQAVHDAEPFDMPDDPALNRKFHDIHLTMKPHFNL